MYGYAGKILYVDLAVQDYKIMKLQQDIAINFLGGSALAAKIIFDEGKMDSDPLSPENLLIFATGPLTGTPVPASGRYAVCARSPLTGIWGESHAGGFFGPELKKAGFDAIVVKGRAERSIYLYIRDEEVEFKSAEGLWGEDALETHRIVKRELGDSKVRVAAIGPAGEKLVKFASVINEDGIAGRTGMGAVMGSKNLKAIAVRGSGKIPLALERECLEYAREVNKQLYRSPAGQRLRQYGTGAGIVGYYELGNLPLKNFSIGIWDDEEVSKITGQQITERILERISPCTNCVIACKRRVHVKEGVYKCLRGRGPDYETLGMLGSNLLNSDLYSIVKANELCDRLGIDTISTGAVIAFAMEAYERGLLTRNDTDGLELQWGNASMIVRLVEMIGRREGKLANLLAEGVRQASNFLGGGSEEFAVHVKGLEVPAHDGRAFFDHALSFATMNRGGCHLAWVHHPARGTLYPEIGITEKRDRFTSEGSGLIVKKMQDLMELMDALIICKYTLSAGLTITQLLKFLNLTTGWNIGLEEFVKAGERSFNLKRALNIIWGMTSDQDTLPKRLLKPLNGGTAGHVPKINVMLKEYYKVRGWTAEGAPTRHKLKELGLGFILSKTSKLGIGA